MSVITISRGSYSRGKEVAEGVAEKLGYQCISRDILLEASEEFNLPEIKLIRALRDAPSVLSRFMHGKERYLGYIRSALLQHVESDNVVYHGLAGHYFLRNIPHVLKIRIIADMNDRVKEEMRREKISEEAARTILEKDDEERRKWGIQVYGADTWDSRLYDMVLHIKALTVSNAIDMIMDTVQKPIFQTTPESRKMVHNLALAAKVQAKLVKMAPTVQVSAVDGTVTVNHATGGLPVEKDILAEIKNIAEKVDGVKTVVLNLIEAPSDCHHINPFYNIGCQ